MKKRHLIESVQEILGMAQNGGRRVPEGIKYFGDIATKAAGLLAVIEKEVPAEAHPAPAAPAPKAEKKTKPETK